MHEYKRALLSMARLYIGHSRGDISVKMMIKEPKITQNTEYYNK